VAAGVVVVGFGCVVGTKGVAEGLSVLMLVVGSVIGCGRDVVCLFCLIPSGLRRSVASLLNSRGLHFCVAVCCVLGRASDWLCVSWWTPSVL
jgi:hypothetical protein